MTLEGARRESYARIDAIYGRGNLRQPGWQAGREQRGPDRRAADGTRVFRVFLARFAIPWATIKGPSHPAAQGSLEKHPLQRIAQPVASYPTVLVCVGTHPHTARVLCS